jgi:NAD(P)-dependent dehydrogenase (short-subunit alcohol dehydrogenase family)
MTKANHSALVTGGGSGIGLACAAEFLGQGATVGLLGRTESKLREGADSLLRLYPGASVELFVGDTADEGLVADALSQMDAIAPLKKVLANAGIGGLAPVAAQDADQYDEIMRINAKGTLLVFKHAARHLAKNNGGAMCAVSSIAGLRTHPYMAAYCMSKAAIDMLVRNCADELGASGIRVNSVCPGLVETEIASGLLGTEAVYHDYLNKMPIARHGFVADIAAAVAFLCSDSASWITGVSLPVDGGHHLRQGPDVSVFATTLFGDSAEDPKSFLGTSS